MADQVPKRRRESWRLRHGVTALRKQVERVDVGLADEQVLAFAAMMDAAEQLDTRDHLQHEFGPLWLVLRQTEAEVWRRVAQWRERAEESSVPLGPAGASLTPTE